MASRPQAVDAWRVLAIDGGGVRGIIPARVLAALEAASGRPVAELFDLLVGTSIGGLAALALTMPGPDGAPAHTPDSATRLLAGHKGEIFPGSDMSMPHAVADARRLVATMARTGLAATGRHRDRGNARYSPEPYEAALVDFFGDTRLSDAITPIVVTAFDALRDRPVHLRSVDAAADAAFDLPMAVAARAATAAPTFFPPMTVNWGGRQVVLLDGGVFANVASLVGYAEARRHATARGRPADRILLVSLGTGRRLGSPDRAADDFARRNWVALGERLMRAAQAGQEETYDRLLRDLLGDDYVRLQPVLPDDTDFGMDDASDERLSALVTIADRFVADRLDEIERLGALLAGASRR